MNPIAASTSPDGLVSGPNAGPISKFMLVVAYDGTAYQGWQTQKIGVGVQQKLEEALTHIFGGRHPVMSSSRTDTGVHALGMVAEVVLPARAAAMPLRKLPLAINAWLPEDIRVTSARRVPPEFHARFQAVAKQYRYFVWNHAVMNPLLRNRAWHVPHPLDWRAMQAGAGLLLGRHDFRSFAAKHPYEIEDTVRDLRRLTVRREGPLLTFVIEANGFLYKMCRGLVGTLVQVGQGRFSPQDVVSMLSSRDRRAAGVTAPPHGLVLWKVFYPKSLRSKPAGNSKMPAAA